MKHFIKIAGLFIFLISLCCTKATEPIPIYPFDVDVRISGTDSLYFQGIYGNASTSIEVEDTIPTPVSIGDPDYVQYISSIDNAQDEVFAHFRKLQASGTLTVQIGLPLNQDFELKEEASTTASYGSVSISWKP
jgi:hypothetical protein